jgi:polyhydroxybutyrate depolymerase
MNRIFLLLVPLAIGCSPTASPLAEAADAKPGGHGTFNDEFLTVGKQKRSYRLVVPKTVDLEKPAPLVFAFHGMGIDSKDFMPKYTKLDDLATDKKFILVYPEAEGRSWGIAPEKVKNDLAFFDDLLKTIQGKYKVDPDRIHVLGMSNGGYFAHLIGKERSKTVAAVAGHSTSLGLQTLGGIKAERKFPVMIVHGDQDRILPVEWARENRDKCKKEGHDVTYVEIKGMGHTWATEQKINEQIWEFFEKNPRK